MKTTLLCENDAIELENYETKRKRHWWSGVLIAIKKEMKSIVIKDDNAKKLLIHYGYVYTTQKKI